MGIFIYVMSLGCVGQMPRSCALRVFDYVGLLRDVFQMLFFAFIYCGV